MRPFIFANRKNLMPALAFLGLLAINVILWSEISRYSKNTLLTNGNWIVSKRMKQMALTGSGAYLATRTALSGNQLDLAAWFGNQEVIYRREIAPARIEFRFRLESDAFLFFLFGQNKNGTKGIRFTNKANLNSSFVSISPEGKYSEPTNLEISPLSSAWHIAGLVVEGQNVSAYLDGAKIFNKTIAESLHGRIGFRGGEKSALIDWISVAEADGGNFFESFEMKIPAARIGLANLLALVLVSTLLFFLEAVRHRRIDYALFSVDGFLVFFLLFGSMYYAFDRCFFSKLYVCAHAVASEKNNPEPCRRRRGMRHVSDTNLEKITDLFESMRYSFFDRWHRLATGGAATKIADEITRQGYPTFNDPNSPQWTFCAKAPQGNLQRRCELTLTPPPALVAPKPKQSIRVLFIGASQMWGMGADKLDDTMFVRADREISQRLNAGLVFEDLNYTINGHTSFELFQDYVGIAGSFEPKLVVIDIVNNDSLKTLTNGISSFLKFNREQGIETILIREAVSDDPLMKNDLLEAKYSELARLGNQWPAPVLNLREHMASAEVRGSGWIWLDQLHMTSYGQNLAGNWLAREIVRTSKTLAPFLRHQLKDPGPRL